MKFQFIKNCPKTYCMNKSYRKYNIIDNCKLIDLHKTYVIHYTEKSIEFIPRDYLKFYKY